MYVNQYKHMSRKHSEGGRVIKGENTLSGMSAVFPCALPATTFLCVVNYLQVTQKERIHDQACLQLFPVHCLPLLSYVW